MVNLPDVSISLKVIRLLWAAFALCHLNVITMIKYD